MAGVGRIVAALASGSQETTVALANLNFDFSLVKVEAPVEFKGLGALSFLQKEERSRMRYYGLPAIPNLLQAYGRRVTEIAEAPHINPKGSRSDGPFVGHVGADGTTIWAAATSGQGSIAVHMLACMLARIWTPSEATSVWTELVMERKAVLQKRLSRDQLAEWDASARAWLRTADEAKQLQLQQLMLILDNISLPVTSNSNVHDDVMEAWKAAMVTLDKLISGMPHRVQSGAVLLGLTSWHLYPDISVLGLTSTQVIQKDPLICPGGVVTIGITDADPSDESGVYWSLPLAYLRHYRRPVKSIGSIGPGTSRVTFKKFLQSVLGRILGGWELDVGNTVEICDLFVALSEYLVADDLFPADPAPFAPKYLLEVRVIFAE
ncbi:MAG: hypothetical protein M1813_007367 [Trichoglossum hirsutum]|nr:MAG: hypothetical protein M1813_007367 [Trichoglossum hirsutum]